MTDIVARMKALPDLTNEKAWEIVYEGAAEIERLRAEVERLNRIYISAVQGRQDLRSALRESRTPEPFPYSEECCPGHVASESDAKICGRCGVHVDSFRPSAGALS